MTPKQKHLKQSDETAAFSLNNGGLQTPALAERGKMEKFKYTITYFNEMQNN